MAEDQVQPPRYTSTPLPTRKTSSILTNFIEVSPIFPTPERVLKAKSMIPVSMRPRSAGTRSIGTKTKVSTSTNNTGQSSSGSVKIPPQTHKSEAENKNLFSIAKDLKKGLTAKVPPERTVEPANAQQNIVDRVFPKSSLQTKPQVPKPVSDKEPRNSVDEDISQTKSCRASTVSQRPSTLPSVPEEAAVGGPSQLSTDSIFKRSGTQGSWLIPKETKALVSLKRKSSVPLTVTKRNKNMETIYNQDEEDLFGSPEMPNLAEVALLCNRRQTYVLKKNPTTGQEDGHKSVTDGIIPLEILSQKSPSNNNLSSKSTQENSKAKPQKNRMKKNNGICEPKNKLEEKNKEEENIDQFVSPSVKVYKNKRKLTKEHENQLDLSARIEENSITDKEKENIDQFVSPSVKVYKNKRKLTKEPENQLDLSARTEQNSNTDVVSKSNGKDNKPTTSSEALNQEVIISEQSSKEREVDIMVHESVEPKKKGFKSKKKETNIDQDQNTKSLKSGIETKRTLRERKPNVQYLDTSEISVIYTKGINSKNRKVVKGNLSQEQKENSSEPLVANKSQRKKTVKGNNKISQENSVPSELMLQNHGKGPKDNDGAKTLNSEKNMNTDIGPEKQEDITVPKKTKTENKRAFKKNKKEIKDEKKNKKVGKKNSSIPVGEKEQIGNVNVHTNIDTQQNNSKIDVAVVSTTTNIKRKAQPKKHNSLAHSDANAINEGNAEIQEDGAVINNSQHFNLVLHGESCLEPTTNNKTKTSTSLETKTRRKTVCKISSVNHADDNQLSKPAGEHADDSRRATKGKVSKQLAEEKEKPRRKTIVSQHLSKSQSKVNQNKSESDEQSMADRSKEFCEDENCPEPEAYVPSSGKKRKSEETQCDASQSGSASKRRKHDHNSGKINNADRGFSIKDLLGTHEKGTLELQPGVVAAPSIHIHDFVMMGEVRLEPGATLSKISTNTAYSVHEGTACVTIKRHAKYFNGSDSHRRFFIPKNIDVSITNPGNLPLKMEFVKFRG